MPKQAPCNNSQPSHLRIGRQAEDFACRYLTAKGLKLRQRNYRCPCGEIDLVMCDRRTLVFIEVRYRRNNLFGGGVASVDRRKRDRLVRTASYYLQQHELTDRIPVRFDVIAFSSPSISDNHPQWIVNAFEACI